MSDLLLDVGGMPADVRRRKDARVLEELPVQRRIEHVGAVPVEQPLVEVAPDGVVIDDLASGHVDQPPATARSRQDRGSDQVPRLGRQPSGLRLFGGRNVYAGEANAAQIGVGAVGER
ncbi:hypothetical protein WMF46_36000 [Sorangium sp. So ce117]